MGLAITSRFKSIQFSSQWCPTASSFLVFSFHFTYSTFKLKPHTNIHFELCANNKDVFYQILRIVVHRSMWKEVNKRKLKTFQNCIHFVYRFNGPFSKMGTVCFSTAKLAHTHTNTIDGTGNLFTAHRRCLAKILWMRDILKILFLLCWAMKTLFNENIHHCHLMLCSFRPAVHVRFFTSFQISSCLHLFLLLLLLLQFSSDIALLWMWMSFCCSFFYFEYYKWVSVFPNIFTWSFYRRIFYINLLDWILCIYVHMLM